MYNAISNNAARGFATATHFTRRNGQLVGSSTGAVYDRQQELEDSLGLVPALGLKYGTTPAGEIDWPNR